jgi:hypothetical protein
LTDEAVNGTVGETVKLECRPNLKNPVDWRYQRTPTSKEEPYVFIGGNRAYLYENDMRFQLSPTTPDDGDYALTIENVSLNDTGFYTCIENSGIGKRRPIRLIVKPVIPVEGLHCSYLRGHHTNINEIGMRTILFLYYPADDLYSAASAESFLGQFTLLAWQSEPSSK